MISAWWLILAVFVGAIAGYCIVGLLTINEKK